MVAPRRGRNLATRPDDRRSQFESIMLRCAALRIRSSPQKQEPVRGAEGVLRTRAPAVAGNYTVVSHVLGKEYPSTTHFNTCRGAMRHSKSASAQFCRDQESQRSNWMYLMPTTRKNVPFRRAPLTEGT